jgi:hypothetical protein
MALYGTGALGDGRRGGGIIFFLLKNQIIWLSCSWSIGCVFWDLILSDFICI